MLLNDNRSDSVLMKNLKKIVSHFHYDITTKFVVHEKKDVHVGYNNQLNMTS